MDPILRSMDACNVQHDLCAICQILKPSQRLSQATEAGLQKLRDATEQRRALRDLKNASQIIRLQAILAEMSNTDGDTTTRVLLYHRDCYSSWTSKEKIGRLRNDDVPQPAPE